MGYPTKVQLIQRKDSQQWYVGFPAALAQAIGLQKGETVEWNLQDRFTLTLQRPQQQAQAGTRKKKR
jgi:antitoxin component of MazEF toxin-antitoxin module